MASRPRATPWRAGLSIALACALSARARAAAEEDHGLDEGSILVRQPLVSKRALTLLPGAWSYGAIFEHLFLPSASLIEESGGFSVVDPERLAIRGGSTQWTSWSYAGIDISDPLFAGAAALHVPMALVGEVGLRFAETPSTLGPEGPALEPVALEAVEGTRLSFGVLAPDAGGLVPAARAIMRSFSGSHATTRSPAPPPERRGFERRVRMEGLERIDLPGARLALALEVDAGARRFLDFAAPSGDLEAAYAEPYVLATSALVITPDDGSWRGHAALELRHRENLFAELHYARAETLTLDSGALFLGLERGPFRAGLTTKLAVLEHATPGFTRELLDPDGESFSPFSPDGLALGSNLDLTQQDGPLFFRSNLKLSAFFPSARETSNPLLLDGRPYGQIDWRARNTVSIVGDPSVGVVERLELGPLTLDLSLSASLALSVNAALANTLLLPDVGAKAQLAFPEVLGLEPFLALAKTPLPITVDLAHKLDPGFFTGEERLADGRRVDTLGGASISVSPGLARANILSGAIGLRARPGEGWRLDVQGITRAFWSGYWLSFADGPEAAGYFADGLFYANDGPKRYVLENYPFARPPFFMGFEVQLMRTGSDRFYLEVSFSALNAIGRTAFGNGATANDVGVVDESMASPNASVRGLANLDADRAFLLKLLAAYQVMDGLWLSFSARHKDGQPFAFFDVREDRGQIARVYASPRGSPLKYTRPLAGPREDFQLEISLGARYAFTAAGMGLAARLDCVNALDFGNELQERSEELARRGRSALELQIPRALAFTLEASL